MENHFIMANKILFYSILGFLLICAEIMGILSSESPIVITDHMGRTITFDKP